jgi:hypothetical protein
MDLMRSMLTMVLSGNDDDNDAFRSRTNGETPDVELSEGQPVVRSEARHEISSSSANEPLGKGPLRWRCSPNRCRHPRRVEDEVKLEELTIRRLKCIVFGALIAATVVITVLFYEYATAKEQDAFRRKASDNSLKVYEAIGTSIHTTMGSIDSFVVSTSVRLSNWRSGPSTCLSTAAPTSRPRCFYLY